MKTRNLLLIALLTTSMFLTACQQKPSNVPADPVAAVKIIADKQKEVTTQHVDLTLTLSIQADGIKTDPSNPSVASAAAFLKNFKANVTVGGDVDTAKSNFSLSGSADIGALTALLAQGADKLTFDLIKVDDTMYSRTGTDKWTSSPVAKTTSTTASVTATQATAQIAEVIKNAAKAEKLGDENIGGTNTYHYKVTLDALALIDQALAVAAADPKATPPDPKQVQQAKDLLKDSVLELDMWVGQEDLYYRQVTLHIKLDLKNIPENPGATALVDLLLKATFSNVNKPVNIVPPQ
ncbi:MAG TPA: hypothetical protein VFF70_07455 [Anaerolineae bacterium]|nr:hypothetical protein [Anaerolineae bacterium]